MKRNCIGDEFNNSGIRGQGKDLVRSDAEVALTSCTVFLQEIANLLENLLHYCILSEIVVSSFKLLPLVLVPYFAGLMMEHSPAF